MQFLVTLDARPAIEAAAASGLLVDETRRAWDMVQSGTIRSIWQLPPPEGRSGPAGVVMLLECTDERHAAKQVDSLPLVERQLVDVDITPLLPFDGFGVLFAPRP